jgi:uncharacterized protein (DUF608 family)
MRNLSFFCFVSFMLMVSCTMKTGNSGHRFNGPYLHESLNRVAYPMGGLGAGMICLEGNGCLSHLSVRNAPDIFNEPNVFAAISIKGMKNGTKVIEGPVQHWKIFGAKGTGNGASDKWYGLPRFDHASFQSRFPFGTVELRDRDIPVDISVTGWSPFIPGDADNSGLPVAALEYKFRNRSGKKIEAVFSYNASNFMALSNPSSGFGDGANSILPDENGFVLWQGPGYKNAGNEIYRNSHFLHGSPSRPETGLQGEYFSNTGCSGSPQVTRVDQSVNFSWTEAPAKGLNATFFSVRWTGFIRVDETGKYILMVSGDDGYRLFLEGRKRIDNWSDHAEEKRLEVVELEKGKLYPVKLEFYQGSGGAVARFGYRKLQPGDVDENTEGSFALSVLENKPVVNYCWFRGGWFDSQSVLWKDLQNQKMTSGPPADGAPGATLFVPFILNPGEKKTVTLLLAWYVPNSNMRIGEEQEQSHGSSKPCCAGNTCKQTEMCSRYFRPWYAGRFRDIHDVLAFWRENYYGLKKATEKFTKAFYSSTLPDEVMEAVSANMSILKSPTVLRQTDGKLWAWEGCSDEGGCCPGTCTHVWNYAQAIPNLFPDLERSLRETEFLVSQNREGHQNFRSSLPIREPDHAFYAAADGQLGGIMKVYREWRISGDTEWLRKLWPAVKRSFEYCSRTWDPKKKGVLEEPHHNTYDIEFWGPDGMCTGFYLGALTAMIRMGESMGEDVSQYRAIYEKGRTFLETELFNGEYFIQKVVWEGLQAPNPVEASRGTWNVSYSDEAVKILQAEGPKYQYGTGCISDGVLAQWIGQMCGLGDFIDPARVKSHLESVYRYNLKYDLSDHVNPQRPGFANGHEGGLLLCTWPRGGQPTLPFVYSNEVWTGIEYQVASHLMMEGEVEKGLEIVREARKRYDGRIRNPFDEYECGHFYARALSSYGLMQGLTGLFYDAVEKTLYMDSRIGNNFKCFISCETGFGTAGLYHGRPFLTIYSGDIKADKFMVSGREMTIRISKDN